MKWSNIFYYDTTSPTGLRWKNTRRNPRYNNVIVSKDSVAGYLRFYKDGRPRNSSVSVHGKSYYIHRIIFEMLNGVQIPDGYIIDHIDGNPHNNCVSNLKMVLPFDNAHNIKKMRHNSSGITGVVYVQSSNSWRAIWHNGEGRQLSKSFSVFKYGYDLAKSLAIQARELAVEALKNSGFLYTERHGK